MKHFMGCHPPLRWKGTSAPRCSRILAMSKTGLSNLCLPRIEHLSGRRVTQVFGCPQKRFDVVMLTTQHGVAGSAQQSADTFPARRGTRATRVVVVHRQRFTNPTPTGAWAADSAQPTLRGFDSLVVAYTQAVGLVGAGLPAFRSTCLLGGLVVGGTAGTGVWCGPLRPGLAVFTNPHRPLLHSESRADSWSATLAASRS